ncbi:hypothetical protein C8P66_10195 [Humitalea rosea]|uniref:DUF2497 domain-containing protein n=1 Tax=Humitalea rosea TaxID=990373 RepID=A0A2W7KQL6_9PROT|nr:DUF2497 domain-containing protein [Humitalea rosea]PZW50880.1 hypothetical protein C8P66_10195 [Humitalea rosea]
MSGASEDPARNTPPQTPPGAGADPTMEDILASIRRILNEDETATTPAPGEPGQPPLVPPALGPPVLGPLALTEDMLVAKEQPAPRPQPEPQPAPQPATVTTTADLVAPAVAAAAAAAVGSLVRAVVAERHASVSRGGPSIEDVVREEIRPLLKAWLDEHLPPMVERLVRAEIERVVGRSLP